MSDCDLFYPYETSSLFNGSSACWNLLNKFSIETRLIIRQCDARSFCKTKACDMLHTPELLLPTAIRGNVLRQIACFLFVSICLPLVLDAKSPPLTVSGRVTDSNKKPLVGVSVLLKGTSKGTTTNEEGWFQLSDVPENGVLLFSFTGFGAKEISVNGKNSWKKRRVVF